MTHCLSVDEFADYLSGDPTHREHVFACVRCQAIAHALSYADLVADLESVVAETERRTSDAMAAVADLEVAMPHRWPAIAVADERLHRPEGVRRLLDRATESYATMPRRSLALAQLAVDCCDRGGVAPSVRFEALKDVAKYSLRAADDLAGALAALDEAETLVGATDDPELYAAVLAHARAYVYGDSTCARWQKALDCLDACEPFFEQRDDRRWRAARHLRAAILLRRSDYGRAAELYRMLLANESDAYSRALLSSDLGECYLRMGCVAEALPLVEAALEVYARHQHTLAMARGMWTHGNVLSGLGQHEEAIRILQTVSRLFATAGLNDDELGAELSVVVALRARDPSADVALRLQNAYLLAVALDREQPLRSGARRAAVWDELRSAYERQALTTAILAHADDYLRTIGRGDEAPFVPLQ